MPALFYPAMPEFQFGKAQYAEPRKVRRSDASLTLKHHPAAELSREAMESGALHKEAANAHRRQGNLAAAAFHESRFHADPAIQADTKRHETASKMAGVKPVTPSKPQMGSDVAEYGQGELEPHLKATMAARAASKTAHAKSHITGANNSKGDVAAAGRIGKSAGTAKEHLDASFAHRTASAIHSILGRHSTGDSVASHERAQELHEQAAGLHEVAHRMHTAKERD